MALGGKLGVGALATAAAGCTGPLTRRPNCELLRLPESARPGRVVLGQYRTLSMEDICRRVIPAITDMSWLTPGDSVFVKVACNSSNVHPAVTSPAAVEALVTFLRERGAGKILVGDQAGVEHVRLTRSGRVSSTRATMAKNGLLSAVERSGATLHCFDDQGWDGYFQPRADFRHSWEELPWLPKIVQRVDHIINLTRLSTHALAGYTCGIKNAVGWLRDDSRLILHQRGCTFFEKFAEINRFAPLRDKLRFTLTLGTAAMLNIGPDFGGEIDFDGAVVVGARRLVDHDCLTAAMLPWLDARDLSFYDIAAPYPGQSDFFNRGLVKGTWGEAAMKRYQSIRPSGLRWKLEHDQAISHLARLERYRPRRIEVVRRGDSVPPGLVAHLGKAGGGLFAV